MAPAAAVCRLPASRLTGLHALDRTDRVEAAASSVLGLKLLLSWQAVEGEQHDGDAVGRRGADSTEV